MSGGPSSHDPLAPCLSPRLRTDPARAPPPGPPTHPSAPCRCRRARPCAPPHVQPHARPKARRGRSLHQDTGGHTGGGGGRALPARRAVAHLDVQGGGELTKKGRGGRGPARAHAHALGRAGRRGRVGRAAGGAGRARPRRAAQEAAGRLLLTTLGAAAAAGALLLLLLKLCALFTRTQSLTPAACRQRSAQPLCLCLHAQICRALPTGETVTLTGSRRRPQAQTVCELQRPRWAWQPARRGTPRGFGWAAARGLGNIQAACGGARGRPAPKKLTETEYEKARGGRPPRRNQKAAHGAAWAPAGAAQRGWVRAGTPVLQRAVRELGREVRPCSPTAPGHGRCRPSQWTGARVFAALRRRSRQGGWGKSQRRAWRAVPRPRAAAAATAAGPRRCGEKGTGFGVAPGRGSPGEEEWRMLSFLRLRARAVLVTLRVSVVGKGGGGTLQEGSGRGAARGVACARACWGFAPRRWLNDGND
jgi:hypothetical protein